MPRAVRRDVRRAPWRGASDYSFECRLDGGEWRTCASPLRLKVRARFKLKKHRFRVRATDRFGRIGSPAKRSWKVKRKQS